MRDDHYQILSSKLRMAEITANKSGNNSMAPQPASWGGLVKQVEENIEVKNFQKAESLALEALAISEDYPPDDNRQGITLELLVDIYYHTRQYLYAAPVMMRLLQMYRRCLGVKHPDTVTVTFNAGRLYHEWAKFDEAQAFYNLALKIKRDALGEDHPEVQTLLQHCDQLKKDMHKPLQFVKPVVTKKVNRMKKTGQWDALIT